MPFAFLAFVRSSHLPKHRSRLFSSRHAVLVIALLTIAALITTAVDSRITSAAASSFAAKTDFETGPNPRSVSTADLNLDGKPDLVVANLNSNSVSVLLNTAAPGDATPAFTAKQDFAVGTGPVSVAVGDLDGDGKLDLVIANFNANNVSVLLNTTAPGAATPSFANKQDVATSEGPIYVTTGDLNGDGKLDLAVVDLLVNTVSLLLNTTAPGAATPSFAAKQDFATDDGPLSVALGDLNGDGKLDLAVANFNSGNVSMLLNTTTPGSVTATFSGIQDFATGDGSAFVAMGDLNGDGRLDLAVANFLFNTVSVLFNTTAPGANTANFTINQEFATGTSPIFVTMADVNGDGRLDLGTANFNSNDVSVLLNSTVPGAAAPSFAAKQDLATGEAPLFLAVDDLNGDGLLDLAVANLNSSTVSVLLNTTDLGAATPGFASKHDFDTGGSPRSVSVGDLNGDGKLDLAVANSTSATVSVLLNTTTPGAGPSFATKQDFATGTAPVSVTVADLNDDGKPDLAVANINSNSVSVLLNTTAPGARTASFAAKQDFTSTDGPLFVSASDLNGDGKLDLVIANLVSSVSVLLNNTDPGATTMVFAVRQDFATGDGPRSVSVGDLNGDGKPDLAIANFNSNNVAVLLNTTAPGSAAVSFGSIHDFPTAVRPLSISVSDLNGDGRPDLAVANIASNSVSVLLNTTEPGATIPSFSPREDFATAFNPTSITVGNLNGDGKPDLVVTNSGSDNVSVFVNFTAPGADAPSFAKKEDFDAGNRAVSVAGGDLNGDGKLDLAVANIDSDTVSVLLNSPTIVTANGLTVQQGRALGNERIAAVTNFGGNASVTVTVTSANPANGVTISNLINAKGNILADVVASCDATSAVFTLQASDGSSSVTETLNITVTPNAAPTLSYENQTVDLGGKGAVVPATGPSDDGDLNPIVLQSIGTFTGNISINDTTGTVRFSNAAPAGTHSITVRVTDNCGVTTDAHFTLTVNKGDQTIAFDPLTNKTLGDPDFTVSATSTSGLPVSFAATGECTVTGNSVHLTAAGSCTITASQAGDSNFNAAPNVPQSFNVATPTPTPTPTPNPDVSTVQFLAPVTVDEGSEGAVVTVTRTGDTSVAATVNFATTDNYTACDQVNTGQASAKCDYAAAAGVLRFAAGETRKTILVSIINDGYVEGNETLTLSLSKATGTSLGSPATTTITIVDNDTTPSNPIDSNAFMVRQQYLDFLLREPDAGGFNDWLNLLNNCNPGQGGLGSPPECDRVFVSSGFFRSTEFGERGYLSYRFYHAALGRPPHFAEFVPDLQRLSGFLTPAEEEAARDAFANDFVARSEFTAIYGGLTTAANGDQFIAKLEERAQVTLPETVPPTQPGQPPQFGRRELIRKMQSGEFTAAQTLRAFIEQKVVFDAFFFRAFVTMQYFGYLQRDPDQAGFDDWVDVLTNGRGTILPGDFRHLVFGFFFSVEYRQRFGPQ